MKLQLALYTSVLAFSSSALALPAPDTLPEPDALPTPATWALYFWSGEGCGSAFVTSVPGPKKESKGTVCKPIPDHGYTSSVDFYAASSNYVLVLHTKHDCSDPEATTYIGISAYPTCVPLADDIVAYSMQSK